jgi:DNA-binding MurR/RpiR family transcriptional regulator
VSDIEDCDGDLAEIEGIARARMKTMTTQELFDKLISHALHYGEQEAAALALERLRNAVAQVTLAHDVLISADRVSGAFARHMQEALFELRKVK